MGFTLWPQTFPRTGFRSLKSFGLRHGDISLGHFMAESPGREALEGKPYSKDVQSNSIPPPSGSKLFLSISPLNKDRTDIAPYWGGKGQPAAPHALDSAALEPSGGQAGLSDLTLRAVKAMSPISRHWHGIQTCSCPIAGQVAAMKELQPENLLCGKAKYPNLPVFHYH